MSQRSNVQAAVSDSPQAGGRLDVQTPLEQPLREPVDLSGGKAGGDEHRSGGAAGRDGLQGVVGLTHPGQAVDSRSPGVADQTAHPVPQVGVVPEKVEDPPGLFALADHDDPAGEPSPGSLGPQPGVIEAPDADEQGQADEAADHGGRRPRLDADHPVPDHAEQGPEHRHPGQPAELNDSGAADIRPVQTLAGQQRQRHGGEDDGPGQRRRHPVVALAHGREEHVRGEPGRKDGSSVETDEHLAQRGGSSPTDGQRPSRS